MRLEMEKQILSSFQRLPVLKSSFAGLDTITKKDLEFGFEDYLGGMSFLQNRVFISNTHYIIRSFRAGRHPQGRTPHDGGQTQAVKTRHHSLVKLLHTLAVICRI
jgi:hypothetical protein